MQSRPGGQYTLAAEAMPPGCARKLVAAGIMGGIYFEILQRIERNGYDVFASRIRVPKPARAFIAISMFMRSRFGMTGMRLGPAPRT